MTTTFNRADLQSAFGDNPKLIRSFESLQSDLASTVSQTASNVAATQGIGNATVVTLSPNDAFANERILAVQEPLALRDDGPGNQIEIGLTFSFRVTTGYSLAFNLLADTELTLPSTGRLLTSVVTSNSYANDGAAATAGVGVGEAYRCTDGLVHWRQT